MEEQSEFRAISNGNAFFPQCHEHIVSTLVSDTCTYRVILTNLVCSERRHKACQAPSSPPHKSLSLRFMTIPAVLQLPEINHAVCMKVPLGLSVEAVGLGSRNTKKTAVPPFPGSAKFRGK